jgi:hypothetical protein
MRRVPAPFRWLYAVAALGATAGLVTGCGSATSARPPDRPTSRAELRIVSPAPNAVTTGDIDLRLDLRHARIVPPNVVGGRLRGDRGHVHVRVDGKLVTMAYGLEQRIPGLAPGTHTIQVELAATDHLSFANPVIAAVSFEVAR